MRQVDYLGIYGHYLINKKQIVFIPIMEGFIQMISRSTILQPKFNRNIATYQKGDSVEKFPWLIQLIPWYSAATPIHSTRTKMGCSNHEPKNKDVL